MNKDSIKIVPRELMHNMETQSKVSVPLWFLDAISRASTVTAAQEVIDRMCNSDDEELCRLKSISLGKVRLRVIDYENNLKKSKKK